MANHLKMHLAILTAESDRIGTVSLINIEMSRMVKTREESTT